MAFPLRAIYYGAEPAATAGGGLAALLRDTAKAPGQVGPVSTHQGHQRLNGMKL